MKLIVSIIITIILGIISIIFLILDYCYIISTNLNKQIFLFINLNLVNLSVYLIIIFFLAFFITIFWTLIVILGKQNKD